MLILKFCQLSHLQIWRDNSYIYVCVCVCINTYICIYISHTLFSSEELPHKCLHLNLYLKEKWEEKLYNYLYVELYEK